jgi:hypothetical protein
VSGIIARADGFGHSVHALDDRVIGARLLGWMVRQAGPANWWCCWITHDGKIIEKDSAAGTEVVPIPLDRKYFAVNVCTAVNVEVGEGGVWVAAWFDNCKKFYLLWKDEDGDITLDIEFDQSWLRLRTWHPFDFCAHCKAAIERWSEHQANLELAKGQTVKLAKGERPTEPGVL